MANNNFLDDTLLTQLWEKMLARFQLKGGTPATTVTQGSVRLMTNAEMDAQTSGSLPGSSVNPIIDAVYPIGCTMTTTNGSTNPNTLFAGTVWSVESLKIPTGTVPLCLGEDYQVDSTTDIHFGSSAAPYTAAGKRYSMYAWTRGAADVSPSVYVSGTSTSGTNLYGLNRTNLYANAAGAPGTTLYIWTRTA